MSSIVLVLDMKWPDETARKKNWPRVQRFFEAMAMTHDFWQRNRREIESSLVEEAAFRRGHHRVMRFLGFELAPTEKGSFAGELDPPRKDEGHYEERIEGPRVKLIAEVWSGTDWSRLKTALHERFDVKYVVWREAILQ